MHVGLRSRSVFWSFELIIHHDAAGLVSWAQGQGCSTILPPEFDDMDSLKHKQTGKNQIHQIGVFYRHNEHNNPNFDQYTVRVDIESQIHCPQLLLWVSLQSIAILIASQTPLDHGRWFFETVHRCNPFACLSRELWHLYFPNWKENPPSSWCNQLIGVITSMNTTIDCFISTCCLYWQTPEGVLEACCKEPAAY